MSVSRTLAAAFLSATAGLVHAQCTPAWDTAAGNPGIAGGYAAAVRSYDDGNGERLYVGGSFTSAGGSGANRYLARWNSAHGTWTAVGGGISGGSTNAFLTSLLPFATNAGSRLVVGGFFDNAGGVTATASLAMWNGALWQPMGTGWTGSNRGSIQCMASWNNRLYVAGGIVNTPAMIGGQPWNGMASWDQESWTPTITSLSGSFSPFISAMLAF